jgi:Flp pilus assembly protein CpaB
VTIEVDATAGVEGWATPGAHVDVQVTYRDPEDNIDKTRVAVEDAVVLSYNGRTEKIKDPEQGEINRVDPTSTVTLAVTADDSLKLRTAGAIGRISLALRSSNDSRSVGSGIFAADEWDKSAKKKEGTKFVPKGFAQIKDESGNVKEFQLGPDQKWWEASDAEG